MRCALEFRVWTLGQSSWEASHSPVFPTGVVCACAYVVFWGFRGGLAMEKIFRCMGLGHGVGLGGTESSEWCSLEEVLSPACRLVGTVPQSIVSFLIML